MASKETDRIKLAEIWDGLDMMAVTKALVAADAGAPEVTEATANEALHLVHLAAQKWLVRDLQTLVLPAFEERFQYTKNGIERKGFIDLFAWVKPDAELKPYCDFQGTSFIADWKTTKRKLDTGWSEYLLDSWQWRMYSAYKQASLFSYRGISREGEVREIFLKPASDNEKFVEWQLEGIARQSDALLEDYTDDHSIAMSVWPRNMPDACFKFGVTCPFYADCIDDTMPQKALDKPLRMSYSRMQEYMLCPEKVRRKLLLEEGESAGDTEESLFGQTVHRGLAEVWTQAFKL